MQQKGTETPSRPDPLALINALKESQTATMVDVHRAIPEIVAAIEGERLLAEMHRHVAWDDGFANAETYKNDFAEGRQYEARRRQRHDAEISALLREARNSITGSQTDTSTAMTLIDAALRLLQRDFDPHTVPVAGDPVQMLTAYVRHFGGHAWVPGDPGKVGGPTGYSSLDELLEAMKAHAFAQDDRIARALVQLTVLFDFLTRSEGRTSLSQNRAAALGWPQDNGWGGWLKRAIDELRNDPLAENQT